MTKRKSNRNAPFVLLLQPDLEGIERFASAINTWGNQPHLSAPKDGALRRRKDHVGEELCRLVGEWRQSGPNISELLSNDRVLKKEANRLKAALIPTRESWGRIVFMCDPDDLPPGDPLGIALGLFFSFLTNPFNLHLCGPCPNCGNYFARKHQKRRVYCSSKCGQKSTSRTAAKTRREAESTRKLKLVLASIEHWKKESRSGDWKDWVVSKHPEIKKHWLTRAINDGLFVEPHEERRT